MEQDRDRAAPARSGGWDCAWRRAVLVGAFGVEQRGTPIPPATRVLRLIVHAIPSNKQQIAIKGYIEQMPAGSEWLHIALQSDEIVLWSSDDIQGCFHVFSLPPAWRRWMILSKPIRVALPAGRLRVLASNDQLSRGGNAPQPVVSDGSRLIWLALAVIPMGWLSAVGVIQHLHRNIISCGRSHRGGLHPNAELVRGKPFPVTLDSFTRWRWKVYVVNFDTGEIFEQEVGVEIIHTESLSQAVYREALKKLCIPTAAEKGISREAVIDGITGRAAPTLRKILDHVSLTAWLLTQPHVCRLWLQAAAGRWVFDFQHRRPCFAALDHIWKEIVHFHGWHPISTTSADELLSCICLVPLIYTDMRGAGGCETIGLTTAGVTAGREEAVPATYSSPRLTSTEIVAKALVLGLLRRADHRVTDVRIDLQEPFRPDAWPRTPICPRRWHWQVILKFPWKRWGAHINELELRALFTLLRSLARSSGNIGMRFAVLVDSLVALGFAAKGRSCSRLLNSIFRRLNAHVLASGFYVFFGYVASDANPADEPSRCRETK